jgi:beta-fructofuranosidase
MDDPPAHPKAGRFEKIYDPDRHDGASWHVNDHAFVLGPDHLWHTFGIAWTDPGSKPEPKLGFLEHATSPKLDSNDWTKRDPVLTLNPKSGETVMWAPHIVESRGTFYLFVCTGGPDLTKWGISLATSRDLLRWERHANSPVIRDGFQARDPMILRLEADNLWVMYYTATDPPQGGRHVVAYRTSRDLIHWSDRRIAFSDEHRGTDFGPTESPFVVRRRDWYYLFVGPRPYDRPTADLPNYLHPGYVGTDVFASRDWRSFAPERKVAHLAAHAAEVVEDATGKYFISHCGIERKGLYLAPLHWAD